MKKKLEWFFDFAKRRRRTLLIMKNLVLLLFLLNLQVSASVFSQQKVTLELKDATLKECLKAIERQTDLGFLYNGRELSKVEGIYLNATDQEVTSVLKELLEEQGYSFVIDNDVILIRKAEVIEEIKEVAAEQQEKKIVIRGTVKDENGEPLPFAAVCFKGTTTGCVSAVDGTYELEAPDEEGLVLEISSLGFVTQEIAVEGRTSINVVMVEDIKGLEEVVVTGYQTLSRERATGSFDKMATEHMEKPASNIAERLVGSLAGVNATTRADGTIDFEIRGKSSLNANAQPLVVVDGFPMIQEEQYDIYGNLTMRVDPFSTINPNDVESITVLKDAAAASIWGAKSANGVIVITTKKGKKGKAQVEFSSFWKFTEQLDLDYFMNQANSSQTIEYERNMYNMALATNPWSLPAYAPNFASSGNSEAVTLLNMHRLGLGVSDQQLEEGLARLAKLNNRDQIRDNFMDNPFTQQYNLRVSGGNDVMSNTVSLMYEGGNDNFQENSNERFFINFRNNTEITNWLDLELGG
ncbi:MAG: carboxypeptidase-like regulatory domain-containing protein, partial [Bacteroidales bacterium]|nr:carboxypeptidase-like regulatory domain-containing protein [Bacteroidales bacterium]